MINWHPFTPISINWKTNLPHHLSKLLFLALRILSWKSVGSFQIIFSVKSIGLSRYESSTTDWRILQGRTFLTMDRNKFTEYSSSPWTSDTNEICQNSAQLRSVANLLDDTTLSATESEINYWEKNSQRSTESRSFRKKEVVHRMNDVMFTSESNRSFLLVHRLISSTLF